MTKTRIEIIYEDERITIINKPAGISIFQDYRGKINLTDYSGKQQKEPKNLKIIHPLDKDASGIMILAKNTDTQKNFLDCFKNGQIRKIYLAITTGSLVTCGEQTSPEQCRRSRTEKTGMINAPLAQNGKNPKIMEVNLKKGKDAGTQWELLADFGSLKLLAVRPLADIMHQIQIHLQYAGMPLAIDPLYSHGQAIMLSSFKADYRLAKYAEEKPLIDMLTLCAYEIKINDYTDSGPLHLTGPLDKKFKATIKMLTKYNPKGPAAFVNQENYNRLMTSQPLLLGI